MIKNRIGVQIVASRPDYLACLLTSIRNQTIRNWDIFLVIQSHNTITSVVQTILNRMELEGHRVKLLMTEEKGIGHLRNICLNSCDTDTGIRIDDDSICEPEYFEILYKILKREKKVGVVGGIVPAMSEEKKYMPLEFMKENVRITPHYDVNWMTHYFYNTTDKYYHIEAQNITSSYMYYNSVMRRVGFAEFNDDLGGFREETYPLILLNKLGYKHYFCPGAVCWHLFAPTGGTREMWNRVGLYGRFLADERFKDNLKRNDASR